MFHIAHKIAVAAFLVGMAPLAVTAETVRATDNTATAPTLQTGQQAMPSQAGRPMSWQTPVTSTPSTHQQQMSAVSPAASPDPRKLQAPQDRNWVFRDPRLEY